MTKAAVPSAIGAVIIDNETRQILGKGHNTLVQENHPYNHGETSAIRDAGRRDQEDALGIALYAEYRQKSPQLDLEDWKGRAAVNGAAARGAAP